MRLLGLDVGSARIGVAIGDTETRLASPWGIIKAQPEEAAFFALADLIKKEVVGGLVVGIPQLLRERGQETKQQRVIRSWASRFHDAYPNVELFYEDESLSSAQAARWQLEQEQRGKRDDLAALVILQSYLDAYGNVPSR